jgi:hypothetical protein
VQSTFAGTWLSEQNPKRKDSWGWTLGFKPWLGIDAKGYFLFSFGQLKGQLAISH